MKKVVLALAVVFGVAMVSCSDKKAEAVDSDTVVAVEEVANDSDTVVAAVAEAGDSAVAVVAEEVPAEPAK